MVVYEAYFLHTASRSDALVLKPHINLRQANGTVVF